MLSLSGFLLYVCVLCFVYSFGFLCTVFVSGRSSVLAKQEMKRSKTTFSPPKKYALCLVRAIYLHPSILVPLSLLFSIVLLVCVCSLFYMSDLLTSVLFVSICLSFSINMARSGPWTRAIGNPLPRKAPP